MKLTREQIALNFMATIEPGFVERAFAYADNLIKLLEEIKEKTETTRTSCT